MKLKNLKLSKVLEPTKIPWLVRALLRDEAISGKLILLAAIIALLFANTPLRGAYDNIWQTNFSIGLGSWTLGMSLKHWVNEGLMTFFFLVIGLEIKREIVKGELRKVRSAVLPISAAIGGMIVPALIYMIFTSGSPGFRGWAIPMATDIAFAVGLLALLGSRVPSSLKLFLLTLAIVDDIGAIAVIIIFYGTGLNLAMLAVAIGLTLLLFAVRKTKLLTLQLFIVAGVGMWLAMNATGVHASITGVILGLLAPVHNYIPGRPSLAERVEKWAIPLSTLIVVPLFAFANTGVGLLPDSFLGAAPSVALGIAAGLVFGKVAGIVGTSLLVVRLGLASLPSKTNWLQMTGAGLLAGIGFTVSIFVTDLAFGGNHQLVQVAKLSIFGASAVSGLLGLYVLRLAFMRQQKG